MDSGRPYEIFVGPAFLAVALTYRSLRRRYVADRGVEARATILHVEVAEPAERINGTVRVRLQVAIIQPGEPDFVAGASATYSQRDLPPVGWTVPVTYVRRLGSTPLVEITGGARPPAPADGR